MIVTPIGIDILRALTEQGLLTDPKAAEQVIEDVIADRLIIDWTVDDVRSRVEEMCEEAADDGDPVKHAALVKLLNDRDAMLSCLKSIEADDDRGVTWDDITSVIECYIEGYTYFNTKEEAL